MMSAASAQPGISDPTGGPLAADAAAASAEPVTLERVLAVWPVLAEQETAPNLRATLSSFRPTFEAEKMEIHFEVKNAAQQDWIERKRRMDMENTLRRELGNAAVRLVIDVAPVVEDNTAQRLYMSTDKDKYLSENSAEYRNLKTDFDLEVK